MVVFSFVSLAPLLWGASRSAAYNSGRCSRAQSIVLGVEATGVDDPLDVALHPTNPFRMKPRGHERAVFSRRARYSGFVSEAIGAERSISVSIARHTA